MTQTIGSCPECKQPDVPLAYHWDAAYWACPACLAKAKLGVPLAGPPPEEPTGPRLNSFTSRVERKIMRGEGKSSPAAVLAAPAGATDSGSFVGYLAAIGNKDRQGDTILPGALDATVEAFRAGDAPWLLTDAHSDRGSDVVAVVRSAAVDGYGVRVEGDWMPTEPAQRLRKMAAAGTRLGLSIDYLPEVWRPDGAGGRLLDRVAIFGGAVTPIPANERAVILAGKDAGSLLPGTVLTVEQDIEAGRAARDPDRDRIRREDELLAAASWPPPHFPRDTRLALLAGVAQAKAQRELAGDPERERARARWERENRYSSDLAEWMASH